MVSRQTSNLAADGMGKNLRLVWANAKFQDIFGQWRFAGEKTAQGAFLERERLFYIRGAVFSSLADESLNKLTENCKQDLENIYNFLYLSGKFKPNPLLNEKGTIEYQVTEFIFNSLFKVINKNTPIEPEYTLPNFIEAFKPKNPMRLHVEKYSETEPKGFQKLIHNLTSK